MDALSAALEVIRLTGAVFFTARMSSPWSVQSPPPGILARTLGVRADCIAQFHVVVEGRCWVVLDGIDPVEVDAGTVVLFPHGHEHVMTSRLDARPRPIVSLFPADSDDRVPCVVHGGGGRVAHFICGYLHCDARFNPLIGALPTLIIACPRRGVVWSASAGQGAESLAADGSADADAWLETTLRRTVEEATGERPGAGGMLGRLTELLYVEVLRHYMQRLPAGHTGWLAGVRDRDVGRALRLLHARPERSWTVDALARDVGLSRSALARRFTEMIGEPPMRYLAGWRMQLAQQLLRQPTLSIAQVASRVGFRSPVAFHRAFKRRVGEAPAAWRSRAAL